MDFGDPLGAGKNFGIDGYGTSTCQAKSIFKILISIMKYNERLALHWFELIGKFVVQGVKSGCKSFGISVIAFSVCRIILRKNFGYFEGQDFRIFRIKPEMIINFHVVFVMHTVMFLMVFIVVFFMMIIVVLFMALIVVLFMVLITVFFMVSMTGAMSSFMMFIMLMRFSMPTLMRFSVLMPVKGSALTHSKFFKPWRICKCNHLCIFAKSFQGFFKRCFKFMPDPEDHGCFLQFRCL